MTALLTQLRALLLFYRSVAPFMLGITGLLAGFVLVPLLHDGQASGRLPALALAKLLTGPVVWYLAEQMRPNQYWFFYNLGVSRGRLWAGVAVLDGAIFVGVTVAIQAFFA
ncbi:hypothetical protein [Hymenobacter terricola]|uniref:hypothetical protein n=1 Tax=Hymenobacter terricola TaxID=2819236 RepID=UPI001B312A56|nr:hypothetical protein [Hymenobacter terricola]